MHPLFPNKDKLEVISGPNDTRKKYRINPNCVYLEQSLKQTGNKTIDGDHYKVPTDEGRMLVVWVANDQSIDENLKYFCHGYSFGTYHDFGYSIIQVDGGLLDEWEMLGGHVPVVRNGSNIALEMKPGHHQQLLEARSSGHRLVAICLADPSWWDHIKESAKNLAPTWSPLHIVHSFRLNAVAASEHNFLESSVSSKNTFGHFEMRTTIKNQLSMGGNVSGLRFLKSKNNARASAAAQIRSSALQTEML